MNRNSILLTALSMIHGLSMYGFLGLYTLYLREGLHYSPGAAGKMIGFFGIGALASVFCGWLGDRLPPRVVLSGAFLCSAVLGYLFFHGAESVVAARTLTCLYGVVASAILYVNLAGYHVKAVRGNLASRASGMFVTSLYFAAAFAGSLMGWIEANHGWAMAGIMQMSVLSIVGAVLALALRPSEMSPVAGHRMTMTIAAKPLTIPVHGERDSGLPVSVLQNAPLTSDAPPPRLSEKSQRVAVICGCLVAFAYSANYTNHGSTRAGAHARIRVQPGAGRIFNDRNFCHSCRHADAGRTPRRPAGLETRDFLRFDMGGAGQSRDGPRRRVLAVAGVQDFHRNWHRNLLRGWRALRSRKLRPDRGCIWRRVFLAVRFNSARDS